ncbi:ComEA family DNA-binding protein [Myxacorys almedinensis]|uniref:ComEA family DNA-binding protein n=1 Tax=Myxacorys almedinensis A TaxID=2690445 RepID=A0A8J7Z3U0_9CYAN|nr:ComEA family DNA-binding protein [Myxacorys almedinensis]NDJ19917.1 ComEA family DNA-binding protein [Myxacorys almedinensis A]
MGVLDWFISGSKLAGRWALPNPMRSLKFQIQNDPYYRFQSLEDIKIAASLGIQIDVNQATIDDWLRLPGLSIHQARLLTGLSRSGIQFVCADDVAAALGISAQRVKPLEPIMQFCYYDIESLHQIRRVNLNTASAEELTQIPAIKPVLAHAIARNRTTNGNYKHLVDLQERLSLPSQITADLMHYLTF